MSRWQFVCSTRRLLTLDYSTWRSSERRGSFSCRDLGSANEEVDFSFSIFEYNACMDRWSHSACTTCANPSRLAAKVADSTYGQVDFHVIGILKVFHPSRQINAGRLQWVCQSFPWTWGENSPPLEIRHAGPKPCLPHIEDPALRWCLLWERRKCHFKRSPSFCSSLSYGTTKCYLEVLHQWLNSPNMSAPSRKRVTL